MKSSKKKESQRNLEQDNISRIERGARFAADFELKVAAKAPGVSGVWLLDNEGRRRSIPSPSPFAGAKKRIFFPNAIVECV